MRVVLVTVMLPHVTSVMLYFWGKQLVLSAQTVVLPVVFSIFNFATNATLDF
jgi:hypothetical protein